MSRGSELTEGEELVARMNAIRNVSEVHVAQLHAQAQRLGDWREHVRAQPLLAVTAASAVGFVVTSKLFGGRSCPPKAERRQSAEADADVATTATTAGISSGLMAFAGSLASAAVKQYALQKLRGMAEYDRS